MPKSGFTGVLSTGIALSLLVSEATNRGLSYHNLFATTSSTYGDTERLKKRELLNMQLLTVDTARRKNVGYFATNHHHH